MIFPVPSFTSLFCRPRAGTFLCLVFCALIFTLSAHAETDLEPGALMTGKTLGLLCASKKSDDQFACQSYIAGVIDYHRLLRGLGTAPTVDFCLPRVVDMTQIKKIVLNYLIRRTEHRDFVAAPAVALSLYNAYPCKKRR